MCVSMRVNEVARNKPRLILIDKFHDRNSKLSHTDRIS